MSTLVLSLDPRVEDRIIHDLVDAGHTVVARVETAAQIIEVVTSGEVDRALVSATRSRLDDATMAACDDRAVRLVALASGDLQRRHAASVGVFEVLPENAEWQEIDRMLSDGISAGQRGTSASLRPKGRVLAIW